MLHLFKEKQKGKNHIPDVKTKIILTYFFENNTQSDSVRYKK
jgi:hypothetical protein